MNNTYIQKHYIFNKENYQKLSKTNQFQIGGMPKNCQQHNCQQHKSAVLSEHTTKEDNILLVLAASAHGQYYLGVEDTPERLRRFFGIPHGKIVDPKLQDVSIEKEEDKMVITLNNVPILKPGLVALVNQQLHDAIKMEGINQMNLSGHLPRVLTIGGDHTIAIGSISAIALLTNQAIKKKIKVPFSKSDLVVFWIDAHADINTPKTTKTGNLHGCPVSLLAGIGMEGWDLLKKFSWCHDRIKEEFEDDDPERFIDHKRIVYIGLRDVEKLEQEIINDLGILEFPMSTVIKKYKRNFDKIINEALHQVDPFGECGIHISFDIDSIDPKWAPSTGTPVPDGLLPAEGVKIIKKLKETGRLISMDLVEVNPQLGNKKDVQQTLETAMEIIKAFTDGA